MKEIHLAGGSFWDLQHYFDCVAGVVNTQVGFANGNMIHPSYMEVCTGQTGFAETVKVQFEESVLPLKSILELYIKAVGTPVFTAATTSQPTQYRYAIYFSNVQECEEITSYIAELCKRSRQAMYVEIEPLRNYYPAEAYHQHYLQKNPMSYRNIGREAFIYAGEYKV